MFKQEVTDTKQLIFQTAMDLFREKGLEATTMREVAKEAGVAVGAAYHYFPSKEAIVGEYFEQIQLAHQNAVSNGLKNAKTLKARLHLAYGAILTLIQNDQKVMGGLMKFVGEPHHPLSVLGEATRPNQRAAMNVYVNAVEDKVPAELMDLLPSMMWSLHMGLILYFVYDESEGFQKTKALMEGSIEMMVQFVTLNSNPILQPFARPVRRKISKLLDEAGLVL